MNVSSNYDVLIIGSGIAGLVCATKLAETDLKIAIVTREKDPNISNTSWAQGGIIYPRQSDKTFKNDILKASSNTSNPAAIDLIFREGKKIIDELLLDKVKTNFEKDEDGNLKFTKEAAHSESRILYQGDYTGKEIQLSLLNYLKEYCSNVTFLEQHTAIDLITACHHGVSISQRYEEQRVLGAYLFDQKSEKVKKTLSKFTILATGGVGALYLHHSNSDGARGDGHAMAKRAGASLIDMEFIQFHPTTFFDSSGHRRFLISEALRGEGGVLINSRNERFMKRYHPDQELAPRDVVARAIAQEMIETKHDCVYLDITNKSKDELSSRFPTIFKHCLEKGINISEQLIPVVPAAHYTCGGVKVDLEGKTGLKGLYAIGEVACTGLHGANRLASTSLLEGLVFGHLAAKSLMKSVDGISVYNPALIRDWKEGEETVDKALIHQDWITLKQTMWNYVGLTRTTNRLKRGQAMFTELHDEIGRFYKSCKLTDELIGLRNAVEVGWNVMSASSRNKESVGCFYRV